MIRVLRSSEETKFSFLNSFFSILFPAFQVPFAKFNHPSDTKQSYLGKQINWFSILTSVTVRDLMQGWQSQNKTCEHETMSLSWWGFMCWWGRSLGKGSPLCTLLSHNAAVSKRNFFCRISSSNNLFFFFTPQSICKEQCVWQENVLEMATSFLCIFPIYSLPLSQSLVPYQTHSFVDLGKRDGGISCCHLFPKSQASKWGEDLGHRENGLKRSQGQGDKSGGRTGRTLLPNSRSGFLWAKER